MRKNKIPMKKVQEAFSAAIRRRDCSCRVQNYEPCYGSLQCSHYFTQGANSALMFYPPNAYAQCAKHHRAHHDSTDNFYRDYLISFHLDDLLYMETVRHKYIKYTDELKAEIIRLCNADKLDELKELIEENLK